MITNGWRKSWCKENIFGKDGKGVTSKRRLAVTSRSIWDDYLDLSHLSPVRGTVCVSKGVGYTTFQLSKMLVCDESIIQKANEEMLKEGMIDIDVNGCIAIVNWKKHQSEYDRQKRYRLQGGVTSDGYSQSDPIDKDKDKDIYIHDRKRLIQTLADVRGWNLTNLTPQDYGRLNKAINSLLLRTTDIEEIIGAIKWVAQDAKTRGYSWTLETVNKKWLDYQGQKQKQVNQDEDTL